MATRLQEFIPELVLLQAEPSAAVRKMLVEIVEEAASVLPQPPILQACTTCLASMLSDGTAAVLKRVLPACMVVFRTDFAVAAAQVFAELHRSQFAASGTAFDSLFFAVHNHAMKCRDPS
jgi:hypothetical protein